MPKCDICGKDGMTYEEYVDHIRNIHPKRLTFEMISADERVGEIKECHYIIKGRELKKNNPELYQRVI
jgi:hypothetical protein